MASKMRLALVCTLLLSTVGAWTPTAQAAQRACQTLSTKQLALCDGSGQVRITVRGTVLGKVDQGTIVIRRQPFGPSPLISGEGETEELDGQTTAYRGEGYQFLLPRGPWVLQIDGAGISLSVQGRGTSWLRGTGGTYSTGGALERPWPRFWRVLRLGGVAERAGRPVQPPGRAR